ncbi:MAG: hypothetical protein ABI868_17535 [Acidobacteriota bacterium]
MRNRMIQSAAVIALVAVSAYGPATARLDAVETSPSLSSIGPLTFSPDGTLYAADPQAATIFALDLGTAASGGAPGTASVAGIDQKIAAMLGTDAKEIAITDLAVHPKTHNSFVSVMRGQGASARPALLRIDGAGKIDLVAAESLKSTSVTLPNPPAVATTGRSNRSQSITKLAYANGRVWVAGLSNEEFASKLWSVAYPFTKADTGTSVEIYHGNHQQLETRSPVYAFVPYTIDNQPYIIGAYLCTPLVKFPVSALAPGAKYRGTTIAELGAGNRPIDMVLYKKNGKEFLLMSNTSRGVMKIPTQDFATAAPITTPVTSETGGVAYEKVTAMTGIQQLDLLDATHSVVIASANAGLNLTAAELP